jgi:hypothetical protein
MKHAGSGKYLCENPDCSVIEVHANGMKPPVIRRVKRAAVLINRPHTPFRSGICPTCGRVVERIGDIHAAICTGGRGKRQQHPAVEITLEKGLYEADLKIKRKEVKE